MRTGTAPSAGCRRGRTAPTARGLHPGRLSIPQPRRLAAHQRRAGAPPQGRGQSGSGSGSSPGPAVCYAGPRPRAPARFGTCTAYTRVHVWTAQLPATCMCHARRRLHRGKRATRVLAVTVRVLGAEELRLASCALVSVHWPLASRLDSREIAYLSCVVTKQWQAREGGPAVGPPLAAVHHCRLAAPDAVPQHQLDDFPAGAVLAAALKQPCPAVMAHRLRSRLAVHRRRSSCFRNCMHTLWTSGEIALRAEQCLRCQNCL